MNAAFEVGAAALRAEQRALEILANNVANVNTPTFKRSNVLFSEVLGREAASLDDNPGASVQNATAGGARVSERPLLALQGELRETGNPLDLAIAGDGLIEVVGPGGTPLLWRGGGLKVTEDGLLATSDGMVLRAGITVPLDAQTLTIATDGVVSVSTDNGETLEIGEIDLFRFTSDAELERLDKGLFQARAGMQMTDARPGEDGAGLLMQGQVEQSNVSLTQEMVQMLVVQRAFGANAQIVQAADQLAAITNNLRS